MDTRNIMPDPCDNRIIRFNNCMQLIACICHILAIIDQTFEDLANLIDFIAGTWIRSCCLLTLIHLLLCCLQTWSSSPPRHA